MAFLVDSNVISEMRRSRPSRLVLDWSAGLAPSDVFLSVISLGEIHRGILQARHAAPERADELERWLDGIERTYAGAILPVDTATGKRRAELRHRRPNGGMEDLLIAATAAVHGLTVATRNVRDFEDLGIPLHNPFEPAGAAS